MAKDKDGNYYYATGTVNEYLDNFSIHENENGDLVIEDSETESEAMNVSVGQTVSDAVGGGGGVEARTTKPDNPSDGDVWLRTDRREIHFRSNGLTYSFDQPSTFTFKLKDFLIQEENGSVKVGTFVTKQLSSLTGSFTINTENGSDSGSFSLSSTTERNLTNGWLYTYTVSGVSEGDEVSATLNSAEDVDNTKDVGDGQTAGPFTVPDITAPTISNYSVTNPTGQDVQVSFDSDEKLSDIAAEVSGAESAQLFSERDTDGTLVGPFSESGTGPYTYTATYSGSTDGDYTMTLVGAIDDAGNNGATENSGTVTVSTAA